MKSSFFQRLLAKIRPLPSPETVARQLRQPSGALGQRVGQRMNQSNAPLYDLVLREMHLADGEAVLEIGFGNGKFFPLLHAQAADLHLAGLDFSADMLAQAQRNNRNLLRRQALTLALGSSDQMPFPDATFDRVFCINVIYFWENPAAHLHEIQRVLKPGGRFYAVFRNKASMEKLPFTQHGFRLYEAADWQKELEQNGFQVVAVKEKEEPPVRLGQDAFMLQSICVTATANSDF